MTGKLTEARGIRQYALDKANKSPIHSTKKIQKILVGLGSGIGNVVLQSVILKKLYQQYKIKLDVILWRVPQVTKSLLAGLEYLDQIYFYDDKINDRIYDFAVITASYPQEECHNIKAQQFYCTSDLFIASDMHYFNESQMELMALKFFLNIDYSSDDVYNSCIYKTPQKQIAKRIGLHGGCKGSYWLKKRWPYYTDLVKQLNHLGYETVSVGIPDEYIDNTLNCTSYDLAYTRSIIQSCSFFIGNDSGLTHLAKGLGVPGIMIFGPTYCNKLLPFPKNWHSLYCGTVCSPCFMEKDFATRQCAQDCLKKISVHDVLNIVTRSIEEPD